VTLLILWACAGGEPQDDSTALEAPRLLRRISLDLRGTLPSVDELDAVEKDPERVSEYVDLWLETEAFEENLVARLGERWHTRVDVFPVEYQDYAMAPEEEYGFERSVGEEPLRLVARIVAEDRSWDEVVTADHTLANQTLLDIWPLESVSDSPSGGGWTKARYTDHRPAAGVLTTNGLWWRYDTTVSNLNRGRVAAVSRILLCDDYLARPVSFAARDPDADPSYAVLEDPACQSCHASMDPAAAALMGFWWVVLYSEPEFANYHPERERLGETYLGVTPAWHGEPIGGPEDLGLAITRDPRFHACAVSAMAESYWRRTPSWDDEPELSALRDAFGGADHRIKPLIAALMEGESYRQADPRLMPPFQLESVVRDLVGLEWTEDGVRMLDADPSGVRVLAGGVDGDAVVTPQSQPGLTRTLVFKRVAEMAAASASDTDLESAELSELVWWLHGRRPTSEELEALDALESAASAIDPQEGRAAVIAALLRDPAFVTY